MRKAIIYKEWIKVRLFTPLAVSVLAGFTAYALLRIGRMYAFNGAGSVWLAVLDRNAVLIDNLKYLPALLGLLLGLVQFVPEMQQNRLKLTLHLPCPELRMIGAMLLYGVLLLGALFAVSLGVLFVAFRAVLAPELVRHILLTAAPWYAAGIAAYLLAAWICLEPTWRRRLLYGAVAACVLRLFFLAPAPEAYDGFLPWLTLCTLCTASWSWWSVVRFKEGRQD